MNVIRIMMMWMLATLCSVVATAQIPNVKTQIKDVFDTAEQNGYSKGAIDYAVWELSSIEHPAARSASIILLEFGGGTRAQIQEHFDTLEVAALNFAKDRKPKTDFAGIGDYEGNADSMIENLLELAWLGTSPVRWDTGWTDVKEFTIPCSLFIKHPELGQLTTVLNSSSRRVDATYHIGCALPSSWRANTDTDYENRFDNLLQFWVMGNSIAGRNPACGSIYNDIAAARRERRLVLLYRPKAYLESYKKSAARRGQEYTDQYEFAQSLNDSAFFDWGLVGRSNYRRFLELSDLFPKAVMELETYYIDVFFMDQKDAAAIARFTLFSQIRGGQYVPNRESGIRSFSRAMEISLSGERQIRLTLLEGQDIDLADLPSPKTLKQLRANKTGEQYYALPMSGWPEPLIHLATNNPRTVQMMLDAGYDIETRDVLGKTPLMVAAQDGRLETVNLLLENGANVNAKSFAPKDIPGNAGIGSAYGGGCSVYNVTEGNHTPLRYALYEKHEEIAAVLIAAGGRE